MNVTALVMALMLIGTTPEEFADYDQKIPGTKFEFPLVAVRGGELRMWSFHPGELNYDAEHSKNYSVSDFYIGKYEVRYSEFRSWGKDVLDKLESQRPYDRNGESGWTHNLTDPRSNRELYPAVGMNHWAAKRYCHWLSMKTGRFYRLPTEAEWEYACRGGKSSSSYYPWGDDPDRLDEFAVTTPRYSSGRDPLPCAALPGTKKPNRLGIYDMIGNVEEWVADSYGGSEVYLGLQISDDWRKDYVVWPLGKESWPELDGVREYMVKEKIRFSNSQGATKGGSSFGGRSWSPRKFGVSARFNPTIFDESANTNEPSVPESFSRYPVGIAVGMRVCRPVRVPTRREQLWHWGLYLDHDKWIDTTLPPSEQEAAKKQSAD